LSAEQIDVLTRRVGPQHFQVLLVDDNPIDAKMFEAALREASTRVQLHWVTTGQEAIDFLSQQELQDDVADVELIVVDLHLGGMDGLEVLRRLRSHPATRLKPIVVLSTSRALRDINESYASGASSYITKAMSFQSFVETVSTLVRYWLDIVELPTVFPEFVS
jgi:CheY-like chemotaxis protein